MKAKYTLRRAHNNNVDIYGFDDLSQANIMYDRLRAELPGAFIELSCGSSPRDILRFASGEMEWHKKSAATGANRDGEV